MIIPLSTQNIHKHIFTALTNELREGERERDKERDREKRE